MKNTEHKKTEINKNKTPIWKIKARKLLHILADTPLPEILFLSSFILSRWWMNSDFSYPSEIWLPIIMFGLLASIVFYIYRAIFGKGSAAHLAALLLNGGLYSYSFIHDSKVGSSFLKIIPHKFSTELSQSIVLAVGMFVLAGLVAWGIKWLLNRYTHLRHFQPYKVILFAVIFMFGIQAVRCTDRYFQIHKELAYHYPAPNITKSSASIASKPDVYYLLFDRYGNQTQLQKNLGFDNSDIMNYFTSKGFVNRDDAFSNYPFTMSSVSSTMAMSYFPEFEQMFGKDDWQSAFPYRSVLSNPPIAQIFKQNGYKYNQLSSWWDFTRLNINADSNPTESYRLRVLGKTIYVSDLDRDILHKSVLSPWLKKGVSVGSKTVIKYDLDRNPQENFKSQMDSLYNIAGRSDKASPNFTFAHILAPHPPYVFDAQGNWPNYDNEANDNGVDESVKYANEATYVNGQIKKLVGYIQAKSPNAVIVVQADEGPYPKQFRGDLTPTNYYNPLNLPLDKMQQKFGVIASYYMPGIDPEKIKQIDSSQNTFRFVLNNYLGYNMSMLPSCNFSMGDKFKIYNYTLVTGKLSGKSEEGCAQYK